MHLCTPVTVLSVSAPLFSKEPDSSHCRIYTMESESTPQISPGTQAHPTRTLSLCDLHNMRHDLSTLPETKEPNKAWQPSKAEGAKRTKAETVPRPSCPVFHPSFFHYVEILSPKVKCVSVIAKPTGPTTLGNPINI